MSSTQNCPLTFNAVGDVIVFIGLIGLTVMEHGVTRGGFSNYLVMKNWLQFSVGIVAWWLLGYGFAFGNPSDAEYIGNTDFGGKHWLTEKSKNHGACASYFALCGFFVLFIINGAISERAKYQVYPWFSWWLMLFAWPVIVAWSWGGGWLDIELNKPLIDYGGAINIHMFAGAIGLLGAIFLGERPGRFASIDDPKWNISLPTTYIVGAVLVILGIFGLNISTSPTEAARGMSACNTWICGGMSAIVTLKLLTLTKKDLNTHYIAVYQGFIAGMIVISDSAYDTTPWQAGLCGILSGIIFAIGYYFCRMARIDDVMNVTATFFLPGLIGGILPGFITDANGCFWDGKSGDTLSTQIIAVLVVLGWALTWAAILFGIMAIFKSLRLDEEIIATKLDGLEIRQTGWKVPNETEGKVVTKE